MRWYEAEVAQLEVQLRSSPPGAVVAYGSSTLRLWTDLGRCLPGVVNAAFGGSTLDACAWFYGRLVAPLRPRHLLLYAGDNDVGDGQPLAVVEARMGDLLRTIDHFQPGLRLTWLTIKPSPARWHLQPRIQEANLALAALLRARGAVRVVDVHTPMLDPMRGPRPELYDGDGLHLSPAGYSVVHGALLPHADWWNGDGAGG